MIAMTSFFHVDHLSWVMMALIGFMSLCVSSFSFRYLDGDRHQHRFYLNLAALIGSVFLVVTADHIILFLVSWMLSNYFLTQLMQHKRQWPAARQSALLALKNFGWGSLFLAIALAMSYQMTGQTSIQALCVTPINQLWGMVIGLLILLTAMTQSALWPFHRWLISSSNSPTPVSAMMHAGLVNGGGFLLARFAPLLSQHQAVLIVMFIVGVLTAMLGTLWKLMQSDVKRMLACSTVGQMGFMVAQCGLGLFPAAIAHLCWHGLFKAYLFLASGAAAQEKRLDSRESPSWGQWCIALLGGICGAYGFSCGSGRDWMAMDTTLFLSCLAMLAGTQLVLLIIRGQSLLRVPCALLVASLVGVIYGWNIRLIEWELVPVGLFHPQPLNGVYIVALLLLVGGWLALLSGRLKRSQYPNWMLGFYVRMLNMSQPHPKTTTAHRNHYQY